MEVERPGARCERAGPFAGRRSRAGAPPPPRPPAAPMACAASVPRGPSRALRRDPSRAAHAGRPWQTRPQDRARRRGPARADRPTPNRVTPADCHESRFPALSQGSRDGPTHRLRPGRRQRPRSEDHEGERFKSGGEGAEHVLNGEGQQRVSYWPSMAARVGIEPTTK